MWEVPRSCSFCKGALFRFWTIQSCSTLTVSFRCTRFESWRYRVQLAVNTRIHVLVTWHCWKQFGKVQLHSHCPWGFVHNSFKIIRAKYSRKCVRKNSHFTLFHWVEGKGMFSSALLLLPASRMSEAISLKCDTITSKSRNETPLSVSCTVH